MQTNKCKWCDKPAVIEEGNILSNFNDLTKEIDLFHDYCHAEMVRDSIEDQGQRWGEPAEVKGF